MPTPVDRWMCDSCKLLFIDQEMAQRCEASHQATILSDYCTVKRLSDGGMVVKDAAYKTEFSKEETQLLKDFLNESS